MRPRQVPVLRRGAARPSVLVVGLGNPGKKYRMNRHNAGTIASEALLDSSGVLREGSWREGTLALAGEAADPFLVLRPRTFMNLSGRPVAEVLKAYDIRPGRMIVLHDDIDLPLGVVKKKAEGGTAGHRGLDSIVERLGTRGFGRVRIGVGRPPDGVDPADYVLSDFEKEELGEARESTAAAARMASEMISEWRLGG